MEVIGLAFVPIADALIRISVVFLFLELLIWWKPGQKTMARIFRHLKQWINRLRNRDITVITVQQVRIFQALVSVIALVLCVSQYGFLVNSASQRHDAASSSVRLQGIQYPNGLIIEFGSKNNDIDPINIQLVFTGNTSGYAVWWDSPHMIKRNSSFVSFVDSSLVKGRIEYQPPNFTLYSLGSPLSSNNSLYLFIGGSPVIESCSVNGERFLKGGRWLIWDKK